MPAALTFDEIVVRANIVHNNHYTYRQDQSDPVGYFRGFCLEHNIEFLTNRVQHVKTKAPVCSECSARKKREGQSGLLSHDEFIERSSRIHKDFYIYDKTKYVNQKTKVTMTCPVHGDFDQWPQHHYRGYIGCWPCRGGASNFEQFVNKANVVHNNKYDYSLSVYSNTNGKMDILCPNHGIFKQIANSHLMGKGCPKCKNDMLSDLRRLTLSDFLDRSVNVHGDTYDYSKVIYLGFDQKVDIVCGSHGVFRQRPHDHISQGQGCPKCNNRISRNERQWLDYHNIAEEHRQIPIIGNTRYYVDGYDPTTNTVYEFNGDFWHGNPAIYNPDDLNPVSKLTYGELNRRTKEKKNDLRNRGFNVISIWENDWIKSKKDNALI